jgi:hypothetical protein
MHWSAILLYLGIWFMVALLCGATDKDEDKMTRRLAWFWPLTLVYYVSFGWMHERSNEKPKPRPVNYRAQAVKNAAEARTAAKRYLNGNYTSSATTMLYAAAFWDALVRQWDADNKPILATETTLHDVPTTVVEDTPKEMRQVAS